jgi:hypothetical protein
MISTILALSAGLGLIILLWTLSRQDSAPPSVLDDPTSRLLPTADVLKALFNEGDRNFVVSRNSPELLRMLEIQRKSIALDWLSSLRKEALLAIGEYRLAARASESLRTSQEIRILWQTTSFLVLNRVLTVLVRSAGVFRVRGLLERIHGQSLSLLAWAPLAAAQRAS